MVCKGCLLSRMKMFGFRLKKSTFIFVKKKRYGRLERNIPNTKPTALFFTMYPEVTFERILASHVHVTRLVDLITKKKNICCNSSAFCLVHMNQYFIN